MPDESTKRKQFAVQREEQAKAQVQQEAKRAKKLALLEKLQLSQEVLYGSLIFFPTHILARCSRNCQKFEKFEF